MKFTKYVTHLVVCSHFKLILATVHVSEVTLSLVLEKTIFTQKMFLVPFEFLLDISSLPHCSGIGKFQSISLKYKSKVYSFIKIWDFLLEPRKRLHASTGARNSYGEIKYMYFMY